MDTLVLRMFVCLRTSKEKKPSPSYLTRQLTVLVTRGGPFYFSLIDWEKWNCLLATTWRQCTKCGFPTDKDERIDCQICAAHMDPDHWHMLPRWDGRYICPLLCQWEIMENPCHAFFHFMEDLQTPRGRAAARLLGWTDEFFRFWGAKF